MSTVELSIASPDLSVQAMIDLAKRYLEAAKAPATRKAYASDMSDYGSFCARIGQPIFAPGGEVLALYIADLARRGRKPSTIARRVAAIATEYHSAGYRESPASSFLVREVMTGMKRILGTAQDRKSPLMPDDLARIVAACPERLIGLRDASIVLLGFSLGARRAALASIEVSDLELAEQGTSGEYPPRQRGPGATRPQGPGGFFCASRNLRYPCPCGLARGRKHQERAAVQGCRPSRQRIVARARAGLDCADPEEGRPAKRHAGSRSSEAWRPFARSWDGDERGRIWGRQREGNRSHHRPSLARGEALYPRCKPVPGECRREAGPVTGGS